MGCARTVKYVESIVSKSQVVHIHELYKAGVIVRTHKVYYHDSIKAISLERINFEKIASPDGQYAATAIGDLTQLPQSPVTVNNGVIKIPVFQIAVDLPVQKMAMRRPDRADL